MLKARLLRNLLTTVFFRLFDRFVILILPIFVEWITETTLGIISEYVSLQLYEKLEKHFGCVKKLEDKPINKGKRKSEMINPDILPDLKKIKGDNELSTPAKSKKLVTKEKAFEKAAKGSKNISSFFTKK